MLRLDYYGTQRSTYSDWKRGEDVALRYLESKGYVLQARNARNTYGEIDLVVKHHKRLVFVEVKTIRASWGHQPQYQPIDNLSQRKIDKLYKAIVLYVRQHKLNTSWQLYAILVYLYTDTKQARVEHLEHISRDW